MSENKQYTTITIKHEERKLEIKQSKNNVSFILYKKGFNKRIQAKVTTNKKLTKIIDCFGEIIILNKIINKIKEANKESELLIGFSSRIVNSDKHIFMADLDKCNLKEAKEAAKLLINRYKKTFILEEYKVKMKAIGHVVICRSSRGNYHLYSFYPFTKTQNILMLFYLAKNGYLLDLNYLEFSFFRPSKALRFSKKSNKDCPKYICEIQSPHCKRTELNLKDVFMSILELSKKQKKVITFNINKGENIK